METDKDRSLLEWVVHTEVEPEEEPEEEKYSKEYDEDEVHVEHNQEYDEEKDQGEHNQEYKEEQYQGRYNQEYKEVKDQEEYNQAYGKEEHQGDYNQEYGDEGYPRYSEDEYQREYEDAAEEEYQGEYGDDAEEEDEALQQAIRNSRQTGYYSDHPDESSYGPTLVDFADPLALSLSQLARTNTPNIYTVRGTREVAKSADPRFYVHPSRNFYVGAVFVVLWSEPRGHSLCAIPDDDHATIISRHDYYITYRRFIVVASDAWNSTCVPVLTYEFRGCNKSGVKPEKHGIIYNEGTEPSLLNGEKQLGFAPIMLKGHKESPDDYLDDLNVASRVNYSKLVTIEHNIKVKFIGDIDGDDLETVKYAVETCWAKKLHRPAKLSDRSRSHKKDRKKRR